MTDVQALTVRSASDVIAAVRSLGGTLKVGDGLIHWHRPGGLPIPILAAMKEHKPAILTRLAREELIAAVVDRFASRNWAGYAAALASELDQAELPGWPWPETRLRGELTAVTPDLAERGIEVAVYQGSRTWAVRFAPHQSDGRSCKRNPSPILKR